MGESADLADRQQLRQAGHRARADLHHAGTGLESHRRDRRPSPAAFLWIDLAVELVLYLFTRWLLRSRCGLRLQAVRDDEQAAAASGVNVLSVKLSGLAVSAAMTAVAGALHVQFHLSIDPGTAFACSRASRSSAPR